MKFLLALGLIFASMASYPIGTKLPVVSNYAYMYEDANFDSAKYNFKIYKGETITLLDDELTNNFYYASFKYEDVTYNGYVYKDNIAELTDDQELIFSYNAKVAKDTQIFTITDSSVPLLSGGEEVILKESTAVYIYSGYNRKSEFTAIKFSYNGKIEVGYVRTTDITPYGVSPALIVALTAIIASVGVILILLGISKKRVRITPKEKKDEL